MLETLKPYFSVISAAASFLAIVGSLVGALIYLRKRRRRVEIRIESYKFALPAPCAESLQSYKSGSVLMSLPDTPEAKALEIISRADHYSRIKLTNRTLETLEDCLLKPSFMPLCGQIRRGDALVPIDSNTAAIKIDKVRPNESVHVEMWHVSGIRRYNSSKIIALYSKKDAQKKYKLFLDTDLDAYYIWRIGKIRANILLFFTVLCVFVVIFYWFRIIFA